MVRKGRPRSVDDEVIGKLAAFGVKPGVLALVFRVHPKTIVRARRRFVEEIEPTIARLTRALEGIARLSCHEEHHAIDGTDSLGVLMCARCSAAHAIGGGP